jgi:Fur family peroxide stress response transcriptional regulator
MKHKDARDLLVAKGFKVTPQRLAVLFAVIGKKNHPSAEQIIDRVKKSNPNIAVGTVYKILEAFVDHGILNKVKTGGDSMRYDPILEKHHHLYGIGSECIEDYYDEHLNCLLEDHFKKHIIPGFHIEDIKLQIIGKFTDLK